jgi:hypothetical protein
MDTTMRWRRSYAVLLVATLVIVAVADFFFYGHMIGWTAAAFATVLLLALAFRDTRFMRTAGGRVVLLASIGLLYALVEQPTWLNVTYTILCIAALAIVNTSGWQPGFPEWAKQWGLLLLTGWTRLFSDNSVVIRCLARHGVSPATARGVLVWVVPAALASVFVALFAWGNPVLAGWIGSAFSWMWERLWFLPELMNIPRILFWLVFAMFAWALLRARARRWRKHEGLTPVPQAVVSSQPSATQERAVAAFVVRCLILFNLVFLVENVLDVRYLGAAEGLTPLEYREYVRRGAYPLVAAALLAGLFVLITFRPGSETERSRWARRLVFLWIGQTIFLTMTAAWRLVQYVELSELTRLRVASAVWFFLVASGLFYIVWRIISSRTNRWLINANALTAAVVLYICCFINFDAMIARFNVRHCFEAGGSGKHLDVEYFRVLGTTSLPALEQIRPKLGLEKGTEWRKRQAQEVSDALYAELSGERADWRAWTLRRARTARAIQQQVHMADRPENQLAANVE